MDELTMLREAFGPDEPVPHTTWERSRTALLDRIEGGAAPARRPSRRRWPVWMALGTAAAVAGVVGVVAVENLATVDRPGTGQRSVDQGARGYLALPFARPASAAEVLENAAWTASRKPWVEPRPDQFMYKETRLLANPEQIQDRAPNGPLVPGEARVAVGQEWQRIDGQVWGRMVDGELVVDHQGRGSAWAYIPYRDLARLTTPEAVLAWEKAPKGVGANLDAVLSQYVLPPAVEAAFFRAIARGEGVALNPDTVNLDGRPAIGLRLTLEGYLSHELLFDKRTYTLIGERLVAIADHTREALDGDLRVREGDLFRLAIYTASVVVDRVGDTK
jgi:hypothetical protein